MEERRSTGRHLHTGHELVVWFRNNNNLLLSCPADMSIVSATMLVRQTACVAQTFSRRQRRKLDGPLGLGASFTSCRRFRAETVRPPPRYASFTTNLARTSCLTTLASPCISPTWQVRPESGRLPIIHHSGYVCDLPANHRFPMGKFPRVLHFLLKDQVVEESQVGPPSPGAGFLIIKLIHVSDES